MAKFDYRKWVTENKHGIINEQINPIGNPPNSASFCPSGTDFNAQLCTGGFPTGANWGASASDEWIQGCCTGSLDNVESFANNEWNPNLSGCDNFNNLPGNMQQLACQAYANLGDTNNPSLTMWVQGGSCCPTGSMAPTGSFAGGGMTTGSMAQGMPSMMKKRPQRKISKGMDRKGMRKKIPTRGLREVKSLIKKLINKIQLNKTQLNEQWNDYCPGGCVELDCQAYQNAQLQYAGVSLGYVETGGSSLLGTSIQGVINSAQGVINQCNNNGYSSMQVPNLSYPTAYMIDMTFGSAPGDVEIGSDGTANLCHCYNEAQEIVNTLSTERFKCNAQGICEGAMGDYTYPFATLEECASSGCVAMSQDEELLYPLYLTCENFNSSIFSDADRAVVCYACNQGNIPPLLSGLCGCCPSQPETGQIEAKPPMDDRKMKMTLNTIVKKVETMKKRGGSKTGPNKPMMSKRPMRENKFNLLEELKKDLKRKK